MSHLLIGLLLSAVVGFIVWVALCTWIAGACVEAALSETPLGCNHHLTLHPFDIKAEGLVCKGCGLEMDLPRGAPQDPVERLRWARLHGMLPWQGGVSVAFLEALRGTS